MSVLKRLTCLTENPALEILEIPLEKQILWLIRCYLYSATELLGAPIDMG
jgi:hypothetical protein